METDRKHWVFLLVLLEKDAKGQMKEAEKALGFLNQLLAETPIGELDS